DTLKEYHIVIDNSNVFLGAQTIRNEKTGVPQMNPAIRVNVKNLAKVLEGDKVSINIRTRIVGGSKPPEKARCWTEWKSYDYKCILGDRSMKNKVSRIVDNYYIKILVLFVLGKPRGRYATRSNS
ncbi:unnamed protein product, partial [Adineta steineri]